MFFIESICKVPSVFFFFFFFLFREKLSPISPFPNSRSVEIDRRVYSSFDNISLCESERSNKNYVPIIVFLERVNNSGASYRVPTDLSIKTFLKLVHGTSESIRKSTMPLVPTMSPILVPVVPSQVKRDFT